MLPVKELLFQCPRYLRQSFLGDKNSILSSPAAKNTQQHQEKVDKIKIQS